VHYIRTFRVTEQAFSGDNESSPERSSLSVSLTCEIQTRHGWSGITMATKTIMISRATDAITVALFAASGLVLHLSDVQHLAQIYNAKTPNYIVARASARANLIQKCFRSKDPATMDRAFKVYVRPLLEYASQAWSPYQLKDMNSIESIQRRFTNRLPGLSILEF